MKLYRVELGGEYAHIIFFVALMMILFVLWVVPRCRRKGEKRSAELLTIRVMTVCKKGWIHSSQVLTRLTLYEDRLVWCYFFIVSFEYKCVRLENPYSKGEISLRISIHGISVKLWGATQGLEKFSAILEEKAASQRP